MVELIRSTDRTVFFPAREEAVLLPTVNNAGFDTKFLQEGHSKDFPKLGLEVTAKNGKLGDHLATLADMDRGVTIENLLALYGVLLLNCLDLERGPSWKRYQHERQKEVGKRRTFHSDSQPYVGLYNWTSFPRASSWTGFADKEVVDEQSKFYKKNLMPDGVKNEDPEAFTASFLPFFQSQGFGVFIRLQPKQMVLWRNCQLMGRGRLMHCQNFFPGVEPTDEGNVMEKFSFYSFGSRENSVTRKTH